MPHAKRDDLLIEEEKQARIRARLDWGVNCEEAEVIATFDFRGEEHRVWLAAGLNDRSAWVFLEPEVRVSPTDHFRNVEDAFEHHLGAWIRSASDDGRLGRIAMKCMSEGRSPR